MPRAARLEAPSGAARAAGLRHALLLLAAVGLFLAPAWLGAGRFLARDGGRLHAPVKGFVAAELAAGRLPEWNPYFGLGSPLVATAVDAVLHPFTLLLLVLPAERALTAWVLLSMAGAALGASWWARELGAGPAAAAVAGLGFAFSGPVVSATDNVTYLAALGALPAFFAAAHRFVSRGGAGPLALVGALSYLLAAAGDAQAWALALAAAPPLAAALGEGRPPRARAARAAIAGAAAVVAAAPIWLPLALWLPHSSRAAGLDAAARVRWNLAPIRLVETVLPHLLRAPPGATVAPLHVALADPSSPAPWAASAYLGAGAAALAAAGAAGTRRARLLAAAVPVALWMALGHHAGFGALAQHVPVLRGLRYWEKLLPWASLFLAAAAALGLERLRGDPRAARRAAVASGVAAALALAAPLAASAAGLGRGLGPDLAAALRENLRDGALHAAALLGALAVALLAAARGRRGALAAAAAIVAIDLAAAGARAYELQAPQPPSAEGPLAARLRARPGLERVVTPFEPLASRRGLTDGEALNWLGARTLSAAWNVGARVGNFDAYTGAAPARADEISRRLSPDRLLPGVGLWGVGHAVVPATPAAARAAGVAEPPAVEASDPAAGAWLVAVRHRPRAYLAPRVRLATADEARAFALDPASSAGDETVVETDRLELASPGRGEVTIAGETAGEVRLSVRADGAALLVLNDEWAPGWSARVDGAPAAILRANYLVRAVVVPAGAHEVVFRYRTPGLAAGALLAAAGAVAWLVLALRERTRAGGDAARAAAPLCNP